MTETAPVGQARPCETRGSLTLGLLLKDDSMPLDIQFSEHGTLSRIVRGVQMILALDAIDDVTVRFDFEGAPWRHFFSGAQQVHIRRLTYDIRLPHMQARFREATIKQIALRSASTIAQDTPAQTWLLTTGGAVTACASDLRRYLGHIQVSATRARGGEADSPLHVPVGICTQQFARQVVSGDGILVVGCGDADADRTVLIMLAEITTMPLTLFDVYTQHVKRKPSASVRVIEVRDPARRATLYASCCFVISGSLLQTMDDHFVDEAVHLGSIPLCPSGEDPDPATVWTKAALLKSFERGQVMARTSASIPSNTIGIDVQAARIVRLITESARLPPWSLHRVRQYCEARAVSASDAAIAWIHCGPDAVWDDACVRWLAQSRYRYIYVDTARTPLIFSCILTALFSQRLAQPTRQIPQVQGSESCEALLELVTTHLADNDATRCDIVHLCCSVSEVLSTRHNLQTLDTALYSGRRPALPNRSKAALPMVFANLARPIDAGALTAKVVGAADATEQVLRGVMSDAPGHFAMSWLRRAGPRSHNGRVYYYPFAPHVIVHDDELALAQLRDGLQTGRIDALVASSESSVVGLMRARQAWAQKPTPIVTLMIGSPGPRSPLDSVAQGILCDGVPSDLYVAPSNVMSAAFRKRLAATGDSLYAQTNRRFGLQGDMQVIPYGVDTSAFAGMHKGTCRHLLHLPSERIVLLCVGRFNRAEACDLLPLLVALQQVVHAGQSPLLVLAGHDFDYGYAAEVWRHVHALGLCDNVQIRKNVEATQKTFLYGASDILVSVDDTVFHTFCSSAIEAMAAGLPVLASAWGSHQEVVVHNETGMLIPTRWTQLPAELDVQAALLEPALGSLLRDLHESVAVDVDALALGITQLCEDGDLRRQMGQAGQARVGAQYHIRHQSRVLTTAILRRIDMARTQAYIVSGEQGAPSQAAVSAQFAGYASSLLDSATVVRLTALAQDRALLDTVLAAADFGDDFELRKLRRLVEALSKGPKSLSELGDVDVDMRRVLRAMKYGILQVNA